MVILINYWFINLLIYYLFYLYICIFIYLFMYLFIYLLMAFLNRVEVYKDEEKEKCKKWL